MSVDKVQRIQGGEAHNVQINHEGVGRPGRRSNEDDDGDNPVQEEL